MQSRRKYSWSGFSCQFKILSFIVYAHFGAGIFLPLDLSRAWLRDCQSILINAVMWDLSLLSSERVVAGVVEVRGAGMDLKVGRQAWWTKARRRRKIFLRFLHRCTWLLAKSPVSRTLHIG